MPSGLFGNTALAEIDNSGGKIAEYSYWPGGLDHLHALVVDTTVYFAHRDGFGNVVGLVNESKQLKARYTYDAWGKLVWSYDGASFGGRDRARFKGALWMGEEGGELYYMRNRWYETHSGRFLSEDPIGLAGGINLYAFAGNNPISGSDPTGLYGEMDDRSMFDAHSPSDRDVYFPWGGEAIFWYSGGGGSGLMGGSNLFGHVVHLCDRVTVRSNTTLTNGRLASILCSAANEAEINLEVTSGDRTWAENEALQGHVTNSLHLTTTKVWRVGRQWGMITLPGNAADVVSPGLRGAQILLKLWRPLFNQNPGVKFQLGVYAGHLHIGLGRSSLFVVLSDGRRCSIGLGCR